MLLPACKSPERPAPSPPPPKPVVAPPAPAAPKPLSRPETAMVDDAAGKLTVSTPDPRIASSSAMVTDLSAAETAALLARLEPLPALPTTAPTLRPPSAPPPRAGAVQPIAFYAPAGKPVSDAPVAPAIAALAPPTILPTGEVRAESEIRIRFDEPMIPIAAVGQPAPLPIQISPPVAGTWKWIDTRVAAFVSTTARFPAATQVTVTVPAGIKAISGATLAAPTAATFATPPLDIRGVWPRPLRPDSPIAVIFDQNIDPAAVEKFLAVLGPKDRRLAAKPIALAAAKALWAKNPSLKLDDKTIADALGDQYVILAPATAWPAGIEGNVRLAVGAPSAEGPRATAKERFATYNVVPAFRALGITCDESDQPRVAGRFCPAKGWLSVQFANAIQVSTYRAAKLQIAGQDFEDNAPRGDSVTLETPRLPGVAHTIAIGDGIVDEYGQALTGARQLAFTTTLEKFDPVVSARGGVYVLDPRFEIPQWVIGTQAVSSVHVELYQVKPADLFAYQEFEAGKRKQLPGKRVLDKTYPVGARMGSDIRIDLRPALAASGTGHVIAIATAVPVTKVPEWFNRRTLAWIQVSKLGIAARYDGDKVSAWAADISPQHFLAAVADTSAELVVEGRGTLATAKGDADGHVEFPLAERHVPKKGEERADALLLVSRGDDSTFATLYTYEKAIRSSHALWYVTDDRFTYKPGEPVYFKGWVRWTTDGTNPDLALPAGGETVAYALKDGRGNKLADGTARLTDQGGFDFKIDVPPTANLGYATLSLTTRDQSMSHTISIQEFRTPTYMVTLDDDVGFSGALPVVLGDSIEMSTVAKYYGGGGMAGADIRWDATLASASYKPPGWDLYHFDPLRKRSARGYYWESDRPADIDTHDTGSLSGASSASVQLGIAALPGGRPAVLTVDATVTDIDRTNIRASSRPILVHPAAYYIGVREHPDSTTDLDVIVTNIEGAPVAGVPIDVEIEGVLGSERWRDDAVPTETQHCKLTSTTSAVACHFTRKDGQTAYTATAQIKDARGRVNVAQYDVPWWTWDDTRDLALVADKQHYKPGDVAKLEIRSKVLPSAVVVSVARNGLVEQRRVDLKKPVETFDLPITDAFVENVHVLVDRMGQRKKLRAGSLLPLPEYDGAALDLKVDLDNARLVMTARPLQPIIEPGDEATFEVDVKHGDKPLANAEVALIVVDEAVLALSDRKHEDPLLPFYKELSHGTSLVQTLSSVEDAGPELAGGPGVTRYKLGETGRGFGTGTGYGVGAGRGGMRGRSASMPTVTMMVKSRKDFRATATFSPTLHTDASGKARVTVKMPDSLTRYRVVALATANTRWFGKAENVITAQRKVNARTVAPRFLSQGDVFSLPVIVQNLGASPRTVDIAVRAANLAQTGPAGKRVTVPGGQRAEVRFAMGTQARGTAAIQTIAVSGEAADASTVEVPVYVPATTESFATYGTVDDQAKFEQLAVPGDIFPDVGGVEVELASTQLQSLVDAYWYLYAYPYECAEQRSARMLATQAVFDVIEAFAGPDKATRAEVEAQNEKDVQRLWRDQRPDGGWGYFPGMETDPFVTTQVMTALASHRPRGIGFPKAQAYVTKLADDNLARLARSVAMKPSARTDRAMLPQITSLTASQLAALASAGVDVRAKAEKLHAAAVALEAYPVDAKARVLALLAGKGNPAIRDALTKQLLAQVHETASAATVTSAYAESEKLLLVSEAKTTALAMDALIRETPKQALITKLARGLLDGRKGGRWRSTQENLVVLQALRRYFDTYEKDTPAFTGKAWVGAAGYAQEQFAGRTTKRAVATLDWTQLPAGSTNDVALVKDGTGRMYYRVGITYAPKRIDLPALDAGFVVRRTYTAVDDPHDVQRLADGRWKIRLGARVLVTIEALNTTRRDAVAIVDPLPAGFEPVNTNLANAERAAAGSNTSGWDFENLRDNRAEVFAMHLGEGTHVMAYTARAATPGTFLAAPAKAEEMYSPETFGRSVGTTVVIE